MMMDARFVISHSEFVAAAKDLPGEVDEDSLCW